MGRLKTNLLAFIFWVLPTSVLCWWQSGSLLIGLILGILSGALFTLFLTIFANFMEKSASLGIAKIGGWSVDEKIIYSGVANMVKKIEAMGGKLYLTNKRLRFCAHRINADIGDYSFSLTSISSVERAYMFGIIPNAITIQLSDGRRAKFVVYNRENWIRNIKKECCL